MAGTSPPLPILVPLSGIGSRFRWGRRDDDFWQPWSGTICPVVIADIPGVGVKLSCRNFKDEKTPGDFTRFPVTAELPLGGWEAESEISLIDPVPYDWRLKYVRELTAENAALLNWNLDGFNLDSVYRWSDGLLLSCNPLIDWQGFLNLVGMDMMFQEGNFQLFIDGLPLPWVSAEGLSMRLPMVYDCEAIPDADWIEWMFEGDPFGP